MSAAIRHMAKILPPLDYRRNETKLCGAARKSWGRQDCMEAPLSRFMTHKIDGEYRNTPVDYGPAYQRAGR